VDSGWQVIVQDLQKTSEKTTRGTCVALRSGRHGTHRPGLPGFDEPPRNGRFPLIVDVRLSGNRIFAFHLPVGYVIIRTFELRSQGFLI
jgi:hypothetical protein